MSEGVFVSNKDNAKLRVLSAVDRGEISVKEAATMLGLSTRQTKRVLRAWRTKGAAALVHGNRGRRPHNALPEELRQNVLQLLLSNYNDLSHQHASSVLRRYDGIAVSRSTVRRIREAAGIPSVVRRRMPKPRHRRERMAQVGMLVQVDGSPHAWFGDRRYSLITAIDDATSIILGACFRPEEDADGYFLVLREVLRGYGIPVAIYSDKHSIHMPQQKADLSVQEQLANVQRKTQFGRCLEDLGIGQIFAHSPQAKGRVERAFRTLQDRLSKELRLASVSTIEDACAFLPRFIADYNAEFGVQPDNPDPAFRPVPIALDWDYVFSKRHLRQVMSDNTVSYEGRSIQILEGPTTRNYAKCRVEVCIHLDGRLTVTYQRHRIAGPLQFDDLPATRPPRATAKEPEPKPDRPKPPKPAADHPWRKGKFPMRTSAHAGGTWWE